MTPAGSTLPAPTLRPGDPPPFWAGAWHPEGRAEGAVTVNPLVPGETHAFPPFALAAAPAPAHPMTEATRAVPARPPEAPRPAAPEAPAPTQAQVRPPAPAPAVEAPIPQPAPPEPPTAPVAAINLGPAPEAPSPAPVQPVASSAPAPGALPRTYIGSQAASGDIGPAPGVPAANDAAAAAALQAKAKELQAAGQLGPALQALGEALKRAPGEATLYAQFGGLMLAGRAWEDAAHHFLLAYMLAPREATSARMTLHAAFVLGYVGWAYQIAQSLYRLQPAQDLADIGRQAQGWLQGGRPVAHTALCPACRTTAIGAEGAVCARCSGPTLGGPANAVGFGGLKLLQQAPPVGRLFVGATCACCQRETVLLIVRGGARCMACQGLALAPL